MKSSVATLLTAGVAFSAAGHGPERCRSRDRADLRGNFGLNRFTPQTQIHAGVSTRF